MKRLIVVSLVIVSCIVGFGVTTCNAKTVEVSSPDGAVTVAVGVKARQPYYTVSYQGRELVKPSRLGFLLDDGTLGSNTKMGCVTKDSKNETWTQLWGEDETVSNHYNELTVRFNEQSGRQMHVVFRVFNDGFGFRYILPEVLAGKTF